MVKTSTTARIAALEGSQQPLQPQPNRPYIIYGLLSGNTLTEATDKERAAATRIHELLGNHNEH
jgi:hypothetical protein